jgi:hypothetical protein
LLPLVSADTSAAINGINIFRNEIIPADVSRRLNF